MQATLPLPVAMMAAALLAGCAPLPVDQAEDQCVLQARQARNPFSGSTAEMSSRGMKGVLDVTISSDYLSGRDPNDVFASCVRQKSGQMPTRPLYDHPDWRG